MRFARWWVRIKESTRHSLHNPSAQCVPNGMDDTERVGRIGQTLLASMGPAASNLLPCRIVLVEGAAANAFCWSNGTIGITKALLKETQPTDDELAFVIGHEMAHIIRQHGRNQTGKNVLLAMGTALGGMLFGRRGADVAWLLGKLACLGMSRGDEKEADLVGMTIAAKAGFDPGAALTFLRKTTKSKKSTFLDWLSTHPPGVERLRYIKESLQRG
jgi:predicted Zn-dependent protease